MIGKLAKAFSERSRAKRAEMFRSSFRLDERTRLLDLGSEDGTNIHGVLRGTPVRPENVYIADIQPRLIAAGQRSYGFVPVLLAESAPLPFPNGYFDVVFCSSVIEHVTLPKKRVWKEYSGRRFRKTSRECQAAFAAEIRRVGRQYFVQTPYRHFPIEPHSWLPFAAWLPRWALLPVLRLSHVAWITRTSPDWYLMNRHELAELFGEAHILEEKAFGLTKSIIAVKAA